jgi:NADH dehydrogenase
MTNPVYQTVILGSGFTGLFTALYLSHQHYPRSVILVDREERFSFKPLLYEYCTGEMEIEEVWPSFKELLQDSGVIFVQDAVETIDLQQREVKLTSGTSYNYSNLVLGLGSVTGYSGVAGAKEYAMPLRMGEDALAIDQKLRSCLQQARETQDPGLRQKLLTVVVVGGGPTGIEMACTLADLLPIWYEALGGNKQEIRIVLLNHGKEILKGDVNAGLRETALQAMQERAVPVELILGAAATAIHPDAVEYKLDEKSVTLPASTIIWTAGTATHPLIKDLPVSAKHRDKHGRLQVTPTLQLPEFPEVFAAGDCAVQQGGEFLPATAQVAYQQAAAIAHNLKALALGRALKPAQVNLRGTLMKLGIENSVANIFDRLEVKGRAGHLIRQGTYLEMVPNRAHELKVTGEWLNDEIFHRHMNAEAEDKTADGSKTTVRTLELVGGAVVGVLVARKLLQMAGNEGKNDKT